MKKGRFSEEQKIGILKEHEAGRKMAQWARGQFAETLSVRNSTWIRKANRSFLRTRSTRAAPPMVS